MTGVRWIRASVAMGAACVAVLTWATPASAEVNGKCDALIKGVSAKDVSSTDPGQAIKVDPTEEVPYSVASATGVTSRRFLLDYAGVTITIDQGTEKNGSDFSSGTAAVKDYAWLGAGLYKVIGQATLRDGSTCSGAVLVEVSGNPLSTVAGIAGVIAVVLGVGGVIAASGTRIRGVIDELVEFAAGPGAPTTGAAPGTGGLVVPVGDGSAPPAGVTDPVPPGTDVPEEPVKGRGGKGPTIGGVGTPAPPAVTPDPPAVTPATVPVEPAAAASAPPPIPGMGIVTTTGNTADALITAHGELTKAIEELPISEDQQKKLTEGLGLDKIKDKLDQVKEVTDTVTHFEGVGTETVDTLNRYHVPSKMVEAVLWFRWTAEASGRAGQKFTDGLVVPVLEPITKAAGEAGVKADATEIAHALLPVQEFGEESSKAAMTAVKNVLGGDNIVGQLGKDPVVDEEWANIRTFK